jgi:prepilin-type N-terminal cleavage/methylation domain-containing protein
MKKAFTLVEIMIIVSILGILAAIALPSFQNHVEQARESAAKDNLRIVRHSIELYASYNNGVPPGYLNNDKTATPGWTVFWMQIIRDGDYLRDLPINPFNEFQTIDVLEDNESFPLEATGDYGWIYKPATKDFRIDWPGTDSEGRLYFNY